MATEDTDPPSEVRGEETASSPGRASIGGVPGGRIGPYKLLSLLGEGGFGVVYLAEQTEPVRRRVALKVIKPGMDTRAVLARFEAEEQALALMDHPNVARVYDAGTTEPAAGGRPYFVMEHVSGVPITEHCDRHRLSINERLDVFIQVCEAVQHAHQKGVIHRDLKPSNILVAIRDGEAVPKVIDFGVAKAVSQPLTEKTFFTEQGQLIGTPAYMSPEQAEMTAQDIDTRTDIYSLGVLLYELLTGALPFDPKSLRAAAFGDIQRIIREVEPPKPSTRLSTLASGAALSEPRPSGSGPLDERLRGLPLPDGRGSIQEVAHNRRADPRTLMRNLRGDLDWITMKALEKGRNRRYASASALAADIGRHLRHEPVVAGPPRAAYRVKKFVRRHQALVAGTAAVLAMLLLGVVATSTALLQAVDARRAAEGQRRKAERQAAIAQAVNEFLNNDLLASVAPGGQGSEVTVREVLDAASESISGEFADEPLVEAAIRTTLADTYWRLGEYEAALPHAKEAVELRRAELGGKHPATLDSVNNLALMHKYLGRYDEAEDLYRRALEAQRRFLGDDDPLTLSSMNNLAVLLRDWGRLDQAEQLHREALAARRRVLGARDPATLTSMTNLAVLLRDQGKLGQAEALAREAWETLVRTRGDEDPLTLESAYTLALILADRGELPESERLYRWTLETARSVFGKQHPHVATVLSNLAQLLRNKGDYTGAEELFREALAMQQELLAKDRWETGDTRSDLGECLTKLGRYEEAEQELLAAHRTLTATTGEDHWASIRAVERLSSLYELWGKPAEAAAWHAQLKPSDSSEPRPNQAP